jgi:hypothetical protein
MLCFPVLLIPFRRPKLFFLKALGPFLACVIGIAVVAGAGFSNGKGPIKIVKNIPSGKCWVLQLVFSS